MSIVQQFGELLAQILSPNNEVRRAAEARYTQVRDDPSQVNTVVSSLSELIVTSTDIGIRGLAAVLLRRLLSAETMSALTPETVGIMKQRLLQSVNDETNASVRFKVNDTVGEVALRLVPENQWNELTPTLFQWANSGNPAHRESALKIFGELSAVFSSNFMNYAHQILQLLSARLQDGATAVRIASLNACSTFLMSLEDRQHIEMFQPLLPLMLETISFALNSNEEESARAAIEHFINIADEQPKFIRSQISVVVDGMLGIAMSTTLEDETRHLALEFLVSLAEKAPAMIRKFPGYVQKVLPVAFAFMLPDEEDLAEWNAAEEGEGGDITNKDIGEETLDRLALALGPNAVMPIAFPLIQNFLANQDWRQRYAAIMALSMIGEGCFKLMKKELENVFTMLHKYVSDPHPRVRWAVCNCVGQMSTDFGPLVQKKYHHLAVPTLVMLMGDTANPKVQGHAAAATINFCEHANAKLMAPYVAELLDRLMKLFSSPVRLTVELAVTSLASVSEAIGDAFLPYYDVFMPPLKTLLQRSEGKELRMLRGKTLECVTLIGVSVGKEKFMKDAIEIIQFLAAMQNTQMEADDPLLSYIFQAWGRVGGCLGQDFVQYLPVALPPIIAAANLKPEVKIFEDGQEAEQTNDFECIQLGDQTIGIRTSILEEKANACQMLCSFLQDLKEFMLPHLSDIVSLMVPLLKFYYNEDVRTAATLCMPYVIACCKAAVEKGMAGAEILQQLQGNVIVPLVQAIQNEPAIEVLESMLESLRDCINAIPRNSVSVDLINLIGTCHASVIKDSQQRHRERLESRQDEDFDAEEEELIEGEKERDEMVMNLVSEVFGALIKSQTLVFMPLFGNYLATFLQLAAPDHPSTDRLLSLWVFDDVIEFGEQFTVQYAPQIVPVLVQSSGDADPSIRQAAVYGVGVAAEKCGPVFSPYASQASQQLVALINAPDARDEENERPTDNCVSSLLKICRHQRESVNFGALVPLIVNYLPLKGDLDEGNAVYGTICDFVEGFVPEALGADFSNLPKIIYSFATFIGTEEASEATNTRMANIIKSVVRGSIPTIPAPVVQQVQQAWATLPTEVQTRVHPFLQ
eukprot:TRINITY_DN385_c0_g1_i1.p1 TRINITY_DN385_c0_g1~~TRINITY_DN385_c0_g1_i1.p1  ORF type:complete len:1092 (-),score=290.69 TRINITY_DN385_c0_g1_i1:178-3453(-)